jgi:hypothetical protein
MEISTIIERMQQHTKELRKADDQERGRILNEIKECIEEIEQALLDHYTSAEDDA